MNLPTDLRVAWHKLRGKPVIHLLHIGKTGGTALKHALSGAAASMDYYVLKLCPHQTRVRDVAVGEKIIFFVRDPVSRFVSGFLSRKRMGAPRYLYPHTEEEARAFSLFPTPNELACALSSSCKEENQSACRAMRNISHVKDHYRKWLDSPDYLKSRKHDIFFIGHQESLDVDFHILKTRLGLDEKAKLPIGDVEAHRNPEGACAALAPAAMNNLQEWYADDYLLLETCRKLQAENPQWREQSPCGSRSFAPVFHAEAKPRTL